MKCQSCHQRQATVVVTAVIENDKTVLHLCAACAKKKGFDPEPSPDEEVAAVVEPTAAEPEPSGGNEALRCATCGLTFARFKERYRLGCADCYMAFRDRLVPLLRKVHGADTHVGKQFARAEAATRSEPEQPVSGTWTLELLKRRLNAAIEREEFEEAARLRDQIEALRRSESKESGTP